MAQFVYSTRVGVARFRKYFGQELRASAQDCPTRDQVLRRVHGGKIVWADCFFSDDWGKTYSESLMRNRGPSRKCVRCCCTKGQEGRAQIRAAPGGQAEGQGQRLMTWAGKTSPFITSTQGLLVYCPDARPARATFAFTQALNHRWVSTDRDYGGAPSADSTAAASARSCAACGPRRRRSSLATRMTSSASPGPA